MSGLFQVGVEAAHQFLRAEGQYPASYEVLMQPDCPSARSEREEYERGFGHVTLITCRSAVGLSGGELAGWSLPEAEEFGRRRKSGCIYTRGVDAVAFQPCPFLWVANMEAIPLDAIAAWKVYSDGTLGRGRSAFTA